MRFLQAGSGWSCGMVFGRCRTLTLAACACPAVELAQEGKYITLRNAKIDMYRGSMRLAVDQWGKVEALEDSSFQPKVRGSLQQPRGVVTPLGSHGCSAGASCRGLCGCRQMGCRPVIHTNHADAVFRESGLVSASCLGERVLLLRPTPWPPSPLCLLLPAAACRPTTTCL